MVYFKIWMFCPRKTAIKTCLISVLKILSRKNRFALLSGKLDSAIEFVISAIRENLTLSSQDTINGCFWHAHEGCRYFVFPKSNQEFWKKKFERNKERDGENLRFYQDKCWRVCFVWECAIRGKNSRQKIEAVKDQIIQWLEEPGEPFLEIKENPLQPSLSASAHSSPHCH